MTGIAPPVFSLIHRGIGVADHLLSIGCIIGIKRDAHACSDGVLIAVQYYWFYETGKEFLCKHSYVLFFVQTLEGDHKLIASQPGDSVLLSHRIRETFCQSLEKQVTGIVAQGVIHLLEPVEVDENNC